MQVKNIECQIAQAQLRRYLTGEEMPHALVSDLEAHLKNCTECMAVAQQQRESLSGVLAAKIMGGPAKPAVNTGQATAVIKKYTKKREAQVHEKQREQVEIETAKAAILTPLDILDTPDEEYAGESKPKAKASTTKTVVYSVGLAIVLVLMSTVFRDPTGLFGPKAADKVKDTPPVESTEATGTTSDNETTHAVVPPVTDDTTETTTDDTTQQPEEPVDTTPKNSGQSGSDDRGTTETSKSTKTATTGNTVKIGKNDIIVADGDGATVEKSEKKPGNSTIKVYPPKKN